MALWKKLAYITVATLLIAGIYSVLSRGRPQVLVVDNGLPTSGAVEAEISTGKLFETMSSCSECHSISFYRSRSE